MKRVALINPGKFADFGIHEPLSLGYIAAYLEKNGVTVIIIDQLAGDDFKETIAAFRPDVVGITGTTPLINDSYEIADYCRSKKVITVMGGVHVTTFPKEATRHCDIVVVGEGEKAMLDIAKGTINSGIIEYPFPENLDEIPPPARHLMKMDYYLRTKDRIAGTHLFFVPPFSKVAALMTSRGCPYKCVFCHNSWRRAPLRFHSPAHVIDEIKTLYNQYGVNAVFFFDDDLFANKSRLKEICRLIRHENLPIIWGCQGRSDDISEEILLTVREAGCRQINFGLESGSQRILNLLKNSTVSIEQNKRAIDLCKKMGVLTWGTFMIGNPGETMEDIRLTRNFIRKSNLDGAMVHITTPFPGTKLWSYYEEKNLIPPDLRWEDFTTAKACIPFSKKFSAQKLNQLRVRILIWDIILTGKFDFWGLFLISVSSPKKLFQRLKRIVFG